eukprot:TRINITY_DN11319_c0_g1_i2.p1 TRINITY_DN11319_c0_g1~~TRINITY_DN11319_c0_g1_i2.p1  ORF type:complete len:766 (-),score=12.27 TRINITY_DN11319_c0_g1_i2:307-2277(-)
MGASSCVKCPSNLATLAYGSSDISQCGCEQGMYMTCDMGAHVQFNLEDASGHSSGCGLEATLRQSLNNGTLDSAFKCEDCPPGFSCSGWFVSSGGGVHAPAHMSQGYSSLTTNLWEAYSCKGGAGALCLGNANLCGGGRSGFQCHRCERGFVAAIGAPCIECTAQAYARLPVLLLFGCAVFFAVHHWGNIDRNDGGLLSFVGLVLWHAQCAGILSSLAIPWPESVQSVQAVLRLSLFQGDLWKFPCYFGSDSLAAAYLPSSLIPLALVLFVSVTCSLFWLAGFLHGKSLDYWYNTLGTVSLAMYVFVSKSVFEIFECTSHDGASFRTLTRFHGYLCFGDATKSVITYTFLCVFFYLIGFVSVCAIVLWLAPSRCSDGQFRRRYLFLIKRWHPQSYFFGLVFIFRVLSMSFIPTLTDDTATQAALLAVLSILSLTLYSRVQPWRHKVLNDVDACLTASFTGAVVGSVLVLEGSGVGLGLVVGCTLFSATLASIAFVMIGCGPVLQFHTAISGRCAPTTRQSRAVAAKELLDIAKAMSSLSEEELQQKLQRQWQWQPESDITSTLRVIGLIRLSLYSNTTDEGRASMRYVNGLDVVPSNHSRHEDSQFEFETRASHPGFFSQAATCCATLLGSFSRKGSSSDVHPFPDEPGDNATDDS